MSIIEQGLIAGLLYNPESITSVSSWLEPHTITDPFYKEIYCAITELHEKGAPIDLVSLSSTIQPRLVTIDAYASLGEFIKDNCMKMDIVYYAKKVLEAAKRRDLATLLEVVNKQLQDATIPAAVLLESLSCGIAELYKNVETPKLKELAEIHVQEAHILDDALDGSMPLKIYTGYPALDRLIDGFGVGCLTTIAAGTGVGKSTFGFNILRNIALDQCIPVMLISLEMSESELARSSLSSASGIPLTTLKSLFKSDLEMSSLAHATIAADFRRLKVKFKIAAISDDRFNAAVRLIREHIKAEPECKVIMIDYPGLMSVNLGKNNQGGRVKEIEFMTRSLKLLAIELEVSIIILAQVNRNNSDDVNIPYKVKDLRDSSSLAHDANIVMFIQPDQMDGRVKINVIKNRGGGTGMVPLGFRKTHAKFFDLQEEEQYV